MGDFGGDWRFIAFPMLTSWGISKYNGQIVLPHGTNLFTFHSHQVCYSLVSRCDILLDYTLNGIFVLTTTISRALNDQLHICSLPNYHLHQDEYGRLEFQKQNK